MTRQTVEDVELYIDKDFQTAVPGLSKEQLHKLFDNIIADGRFLDPIRVWNKTIVDGHHRYDIWLHLPEDTPVPPPEIEQMEFADRDAVLYWIRANAIGQRNLNSQQESLVRGQLYNDEKARPADNLTPGRSQPENIENTAVLSSAHNEHSINETAAERVAETTNSTPATVRRDGKYAKAIEAIGKVNSKASADIVSGVLKVSKKDVMAIGNRMAAEVGSAIKAIRLGNDWKTPPASPEPSTESIVLDKNDRPIPVHLTEHHAASAAIMSTASKLDAVKRAVTELSDNAGGEFISTAEITEAIAKVKGLIRNARYWSECPVCRGKVNAKCKKCDGHGYLPFARKGTLSEADKEFYAT